MALDEVDGALRATVGGKAAQLGALARIAGVRVPDGFVVTTAATRGTDGLPSAAVAAIAAAVDPDAAYAVRSSATVEDAPDASFAGQFTSVLGVVGVDAVLAAVDRVRASRLDDHAARYAAHVAADAPVAMAVVVQRMVDARVSGVLFTADPVTGDRRVARVEATAGLGQALVDGTVTPDGYTVRAGSVSGAGVLPAPQVAELVALGRRVEAALGAPQDLEWCLDEDGFAFVQARPITTLFPLPAGADDGDPHVYVSVGHQQMMTDAMAPLGRSLWRLVARPVMHEAGGRLFVDVAQLLASPAGRSVHRTLAEHDPLLGDALDTVLASGLVPDLPGDPEDAVPLPAAAEPLPADPAIVQELIDAIDADEAASAERLRAAGGPTVVAAIREDVTQLKASLFDPRSHRAIMTGMDATAWLDEHLGRWLGERGAGDVLNRSVAGNVSSEMGLALLDVADVARRSPAACAVLDAATDRTFLERLDAVPGGPEVRRALEGWLDRYGMRCSGEIDVTRTRVRERPWTLAPTLLAHVRHAEDGAGNRRFEEGRLTALTYRDEVLARLRERPDGERLARETALRIDRVRTFAGYREYPKYAIVRRLGRYRELLLAEAARLTDAGVLRAPDDAALLTLDELETAARTGAPVDDLLLQERARQHRADRRREPPRVLLSTGEALHGRLHRDGVPAGALVGLAVSRGTVEGRARVVVDPAGVALGPGDVLVTAHTDPSWSPVFVGIAGLVTEVGGAMTHGAVVAREYGLPAVVGVAGATRRIPDGARVRVHGTDGIVEVLDGGRVDR